MNFKIVNNKKNRIEKYISIIIIIIIGMFFLNRVDAVIYDNLPISETKYNSSNNSLAFPESYRDAINILKAKHPNWVFKAVYTNLDWDLVKTHESYDVKRGISTVPDTYPDSWKLNNSNNYVDGNFVVASKDAVGYCLDPRNFLTEREIFQFETLKYSTTNSNIDTIKKLLSTTVMGQDGYTLKYKRNNVWYPLSKTYAEIIKSAGNDSNVSPIYIASRIKQETGGNIANNLSINGSYLDDNNSYATYGGLYNFYNIGANPDPDGNGAIKNGLLRAKKEGWTDPETAINGGIKIIKKAYIECGQDTVYFQKFDVNNPYGNAFYLMGQQYMTNILAPSSESKITYSTYNSVNVLNDSFEFCIPVYNNMPTTKVAYPGTNTRLEVETNINNKTFNGNIVINGWMMSTDANAKFKVLVDGNVTSANIVRTLREDVLSSVIGYGSRIDNQYPGFNITIDSNKLTDENHIITIEVISGVGSSLISRSYNVTVNKYDSKFYLETPYEKQNVNRYMQIEGWFLTTAKNAKIKIKINGIAQGPVINRVQRADVLNAFVGYGGITNNPTPGFKTSIDTALVKYGINNIEVSLYSETDQLLKKVSRDFVIQKSNTKITIEEPLSYRRVKESLNVSGWVMSTDSNTTLKIYIDNKLVSTNINRVQREDVLNAISGYGGRVTNTKPGYNTVIDTSNFYDGTYELKVEAIDRYGRQITQTKVPIVINKFKAKLNIENLEDNIAPFNNVLNISGWMMSEDPNVSLKILVDGRNVNFTTKRYKREDVLNAITEYGERSINVTPGFESEVDIRGYGLGDHTILIQLITPKTGEVIAYQTKTIKLIQPKVKYCIENINISKTGETIIKGWVMSEDPNVNLNVSINDQVYSQNIVRLNREDVLNSITEYGGRSTNTKPGFIINISSGNINYGIKNIITKIVSERSQVLVTDYRIGEFKKPETKLTLETPITNKIIGEHLLISGWLMSEDGGASIEIKLNGNKISNIINKFSREDVLKAITGYGGRSTNSKPGFATDIDISNMLDGTYNMEVNVLSSVNKIIFTEKRTLEIKKYKAKINIETENTNLINDKWKIEGWYLCDEQNSKIKIYCDNKLLEQIPIRIIRQDVLNAIKGYGTITENPTPGFIYEIDKSKILSGIHNIKIEILSSSDEKIESFEKKLIF